MELLDISIALGDNKIPVASLFDDKRLIGKTGIEHVYNSTGSTQELALRATAALTSYDKAKIGMSILVTQTPDDFLPSGAIGISDCLGLPQNILSFDINQGCSGFVQALVLVNSLVAAYGNILVITADRYRSKLNPDDRATNAVFSDGASASVWGAGSNKKILFEKHLIDGSKRDWLYHSVGKDAEPLHMSGAEVWMFTKSVVVPQLKNLINEVEAAGHPIGKIFLHQASKVVLDGIINELPPELRSKVPLNYQKYGNTVSSTIPILLSENPMSTDCNHVDIFCGFGVGLSCSMVAI